MNIDRALTVMEMAAVDAGRMLVGMQSSVKRLQSQKDFLTDADIKSEKVILSTIAASYPDIPSLSEENGGIETKDGYLWIVDPLDGTINFFLQDDHWGISIALVENGQTIAGVVYLPAQKQMFSASRDFPARLLLMTEKHRLTSPRVNQQGDLSCSQIWIAWGKEEHGGDDHRKVCETIARLACHTLYPQIRNSATADMMRVACGKSAGYVFLKPEPFDIAAAGFIVERAGGKVTDADGNPWGPFSRSIVASNGVLHNDLLRIIKA